MAPFLALGGHEEVGSGGGAGKGEVGAGTPGSVVLDGGVYPGVASGDWLAVLTEVTGEHKRLGSADGLAIDVDLHAAAWRLARALGLLGIRLAVYRGSSVDDGLNAENLVGGVRNEPGLLVVYPFGPHVAHDGGDGGDGEIADRAVTPVAFGEVVGGVLGVLGGDGREAHAAHVGAVVRLGSDGVAGIVEALVFELDGVRVGEVAAVGGAQGQREEGRALAVVVLVQRCQVVVVQGEVGVAAQLSVIGRIRGHLAVGRSEQRERCYGGGVTVLVQLVGVEVGEVNGDLAVLLHCLGEPEVEVPLVELGRCAVVERFSVNEELPVSEFVGVLAHIRGEIHLDHFDGLALGVVRAAHEGEVAGLAAVADGAAGDGDVGTGCADVPAVYEGRTNG